MSGGKDCDDVDMEKETEINKERKIWTDTETYDRVQVIEDEKTLIENINSPKGKVKRGRKKKIEEIKGRERANSFSIIEFIKNNATESTSNFNKRKGEELEAEAKKIFKRSDKLERTPIKDRKEEREGINVGESEREGEEEENKREGEKVLIMILSDIRSELSEMRKEMKEMKDRIDMREKRIEERMDRIEFRIKEIENKKECNERAAKEARNMMERWKSNEKKKELQELKTMRKRKKKLKN